MIYVISSKNTYAAKRLNYESGIMDYTLKVLDLKWLIGHDFKLLTHRGDVLYIRNPYLNGSPKYLPQIIKFAKAFKAAGGRVVDDNITKGNLGQGKWVDYLKLKKAGLPIPRTEEFSIFNFQFLKNFQFPISNFQFPFVAKWIYGMKAKGTFLISSARDLGKMPSYIPRNELMIQEFIKAEYEYKVITVGYKALSVILRFRFKKKFGRVVFGSISVIPSESSSRGIAYTLKDKGSLHSPSDALALGRDDKVNKLINLAQRASKTLGRELAKVDILEDNKGRLYILEVNRFPGLESFEKLTKYNVFGDFIKYLKSVIIKAKVKF